MIAMNICIQKDYWTNKDYSKMSPFVPTYNMETSALS